MSAGDVQRPYDPANTIITVGNVIVTGFTDGDFITAEYDEDRVTAKAGADGEVAISINSNRMGTFEITLSAASYANTELSNIFNLNTLSKGFIVVPISIQDLSGEAQAYASQCWIKKAPALARGKEVSETVWQFGAADMLISH